LQPPGDGPQQLVPDVMAQRVVDDLEAVEVQEEDRELEVLTPLGSLDGV
jgi:hypothetical protein